jgi:hypothetical protein
VALGLARAPVALSPGIRQARHGVNVVAGCPDLALLAVANHAEIVLPVLLWSHDVGGHCYAMPSSGGLIFRMEMVPPSTSHSGGR